MREISDSPWAVLGLREGATLAEARRAFRTMAKTAHPDHGGDRAAFEALVGALDAVRAVQPTDVAAHPEPCRQPRPRPIPGGRPHVTPAPPRVTQAYDWTRVPAAHRLTVAERPTARIAETVRPSATAAAFAAVLARVQRAA